MTKKRLPKRNLQQAIMYYFNYIDRSLNDPTRWFEESNIVNGEVVVSSKNWLFTGDSRWDGTVSSIIDETEGCYDFERGCYYYECDLEKPTSRYMAGYFIDKDKKLEATAVYTKALNVLVQKGLLNKHKVKDMVYFGGLYGGAEIMRTISAYSMVESEHFPFEVSRGDFAIYHGKYRHNKTKSIDYILNTSNMVECDSVRNRNVLAIEYEAVE